MRASRQESTRQEADVSRRDVENEGGFFASMRMIDSTLVLLGTGFVAVQFLENKGDTPLWGPSGWQCRGVAGRE